MTLSFGGARFHLRKLHADSKIFLERCAYPLRNKAGLSLTTRHILVHLKFLPSVLLAGSHEGKEQTSLLLQRALPLRLLFAHCLSGFQTNFICTCKSFFAMYLWVRQLCLYAYNTFMSMHEAVSLEWNLIFFTCLTFFTKLLSLTLELPIQEAQLGFELALLRSSKVCTWQSY